MIKASIIDYLINLGKESNYKKIIINVHYELKDEKFIIENKCLDNPFYKEAIKYI